MRKHLIKLSLLGAMFVGSVFATEIRSPWISERGPMRYIFEKENPDKYSLSFWSDGYVRQSAKAFIKHGVKSKPLTALIFNKADFQLNEIFPNSTVPLNTENYSPYMKLATISPRVSYFDWGANIGARWEYPVWKDKGRIGLRGNIPFRKVEMERDDIETKDLEDTVNDFEKTAWVKVQDKAGVKKDFPATVYRLDFVKSLYYPSATNVRADSYVESSGDVSLFGHKLTNNWQRSGGDVALQALIDPPFTGVIASPAVYDPGTKEFAFIEDIIGNTVAADRIAHVLGTDGTASAADQITNLKGINFFDQLNVDGTDPVVVANKQTYDISDTKAKDLWLAFGYTNNGTPADGPDVIVKSIEASKKVFDKNVYEWMKEIGNYEFETTHRSGFGDIDLDLFYEHTFNDRWIGELMFGVRLPSGGFSEYYGNPYTSHLANGGHWELKFGGMLAWQPLKWMNTKLDVYYSFALEGKEKRCAAFKGAEIKNIGPRVDADVSWSYFVGNLDFNFFHPKTNDLSTLLGYQFYYKTRDSFTFKQSTIESWLGRSVSETGVSAPNKQILSNELAKRNTEAIGHTVRFEGSYRFSPWFEGYAGGQYMFAGQNIVRDGSVHVGCVTRF